MSTAKKCKLGLIPPFISDALEKDWDGTLEQLSAAGYRGLEVGGGIVEKAGLSAEDLRENLERHGMCATSWFSNWAGFDQQADEQIANALALGCPYMVWGWAPPDDPDMMAKAMPVMRKAARKVKDAGMRLLYHNHDHEFLAERDGKTAYDWLMAQFEPEEMGCEMDVGWVAYGKQDPVATILSYPGRVPILHLRDVRDPDERGEFIEVGEGTLDLKSIIRAGLERGGSEWAIVEHTQPLQRDPLEGVLLAAENLRATGLFE